MAPALLGALLAQPGLPAYLRPRRASGAGQRHLLLDLSFEGTQLLAQLEQGCVRGDARGPT